jgi:hypothetical protein
VDKRKATRLTCLTFENIKITMQAKLKNYKKKKTESYQGNEEVVFKMDFATL